MLCTRDLDLVSHGRRRRFQTAQRWSAADRGGHLVTRYRGFFGNLLIAFPGDSMVGNDTASSGTGLAECALPTPLILASSAGAILNALEIAMKRTKIFAALSAGVSAITIVSFSGCLSLEATANTDSTRAQRLPYEQGSKRPHSPKAMIETNRDLE